MKLSELKAQTLTSLEAKARYDALEPKYALISALLTARSNAKMTQAEVATRMGTKQSAVARMEAGSGNVTIESIRKYAEATGCNLMLMLQPTKTEPNPNGPADNNANAEVRLAA